VGRSGILASVSPNDDDLARLVDLEPELRYLLNRWDPIGVYDEREDFPPDEYDCLLAPILSRLAAGTSAVDLGQFLWFEIKDHFGIDPEPSRPDLLAERLVTWFTPRY
jgi:hypothetical protein